VLDTTCGDRPTLKALKPKGSIMLYLIIALVAIIVWTWIKYDTVSPKLVVRESVSVGGAVVGATPVVVRTTIKACKVANIVSEVEMKEAGTEAPLGFREGKAKAYTSTKAALADANKAMDDTLALYQARLDALNS